MWMVHHYIYLNCGHWHWCQKYIIKANIMLMARGVIFVSLLFFSFFSHLLYSISYNITHEHSSEGRRWGNPTKTSPILGHFPYNACMGILVSEVYLYQIPLENFPPFWIESPQNKINYCVPGFHPSSASVSMMSTTFVCTIFIKKKLSAMAWVEQSIV